MAEDEESVNKPIMADERKLENVTGVGATSPTPVVESDTALPAPEVGPPGEQSEVAIDSSQHTGVGDADVGAEDVEAVTETENEAVTEKVTTLGKDEVTGEALEKDEATEENVTALRKDEAMEVALKKDEVIEENVMALAKDEVTEAALEKDEVTEEKVTALDKNEVTEALSATKGEADSCMPDGAGDEKVIMATNETPNEEVLARNDNIQGAENGETVTEVNISTVEGSVGLGKSEEMEIAECEEEEITPVVLDDSGGVTLEKEDEAMDTDNKTAKAEENDDMVPHVDISAVEARVESKKDVEMEMMKHEKVESVPLDEEDKGACAEDEAAKGEKVVVTRNEEDNEVATQVDNSAVEARIESEKDVEMDIMKHDEEEPIPLDEEDKGSNGEEVVVTQNKEDNEVATEVDTSVVEARIGSEKDVEMDTIKHEEEEPVSLDEEDKGTGAEDKAANATTTEMDTMIHEEEEPVPLDEEDVGTGAEDEAANATTTEIETETEMTESGKSSGGKRKRKNTKSTGKSKSGGRSSSRKAIGEDVCFICFDGGDLVLCDRRLASVYYLSEECVLFVLHMYIFIVQGVHQRRCHLMC